MKIKNIINESSTDLVARFYKEASKETDARFNPEAVQISDMNKEYYTDFFKDWFAEGIVPVFTIPVTKAQPAYRNNPQPGQKQSPGYRGLQDSKRAAGIPCKKPQPYSPDMGPSNIDDQLNQ